MSLFSLSGILIGISSLFLGIFAFAKNRRNKINQSFLFFAITVAIWGFGGWAIGLAKNPTTALFWWKMSFIGVIFIPVSLLHFVFIFLGEKERKIFYLIYLFDLFILMLEWSPLADIFFGLPNMTLFFQDIYWIYPATYLYSFFTFSWFAIVVYSLYRLYKAFKDAHGIKHVQIKYFFLAMAVGFAGGGTCFLPCFGINLYPFLNLTVPLYPAIVAYTITRYRLMDIRIAFKKWFVYLLASVTTVILSFSVWDIFRTFFKNKLKLDVFLALIFAVFIFDFIKDIFIKISNKYLYSNIYNAQKTLRELIEKVTSVIEIKKLSALLLNTIKNSIKINRAALIVVSNKKCAILKQFGFKKKLVINKNNQLVKELFSHREIIIYDELPLRLNEKDPDIRRKEEILKIKKKMESMGISLCIPLKFHKELAGFLMLGEKESEDAYTKEDIELLQILSNQSALAIENAKLYDQLNHFNKNLKEKVNEQTKDIKEKNLKLKKLLDMKTDFLRIASHQLRTPVSAIKGLVSMLGEGDYDNEDLSVKKKVFNDIFNKTQQMTNIMDDILTATELDTLENFQLDKNDLTNIDLDTLTQNAINDIKFRVEDKKIELSYKNNSAFKNILSNERYLRHIIVNLLDNAIIYTPEGGKIEVIIKYENNRRRIKWEIKDSGIGIPISEQRDIFDKFKRAENANKMNCDGTGLGLFIIKKLVEAHQGGVVGFKSKENEGSTFWFALPAIK